MSQIVNTDIVGKYFDAVSRGDLESVSQLFADEIIWHQPGASSLSGTHRGKPEVFALLGQFMERSQGTFRIDGLGALMAQGDLVAVPIHFSAERVGQAISMNGVDLLRVEDGLIREVWLFSEDQVAEDRFWS